MVKEAMQENSQTKAKEDAKEPLLNSIDNFSMHGTRTTGGGSTNARPLRRRGSGQRFNGRHAPVIQFLRPGLAGRLGVAAEFRSVAGGTQVKDFTIGKGNPNAVGAINGGYFPASNRNAKGSG